MAFQGLVLKSKLRTLNMKEMKSERTEVMKHLAHPSRITVLKNVAHGMTKRC